MNGGVILFVVRDVTAYLVSKGLLSNTGDFQTLKVEHELELVRVVENSLKEHGVVIQANVDKVIQVLPMILQLAGVK